MQDNADRTASISRCKLAVIRNFLVTASVAGSAVLSACGDGNDETTDIQFKTLLEGNQSSGSGFSDPRYVVARTPGEWVTILMAHYDNNQRVALAPVVDFRSETVLGIYTGTRGNGCYGVRIERVTKSQTEIKVSFREIKPGGFGCTTAATEPHHLITIPATTLLVTFAEI